MVGAKVRKKLNKTRFSRGNPRTCKEGSNSYAMYEGLGFAQGSWGFKWTTTT